MIVVFGAVLVAVGGGCAAWGACVTSDRSRRGHWRGHWRGRPAIAFAGAVIIVAVSASAAFSVFAPTADDSLAVGTAATFPSGPTVTCGWSGGAEVTLSWGAVDGAASYDVLRSAHHYGDYTTLATLDGAPPATSYVDGTVNPDPTPVGQYFYRIRAHTADATVTSATRDTTACPGYMTTLAGGTGPASAPATHVLQQPAGVAVDGATLYVADHSGVLRAVDLNTGAETVVAGNASPVASGDGGPATLAGIGSPFGPVVDSLGNRYVSDGNNHVVRKITPGGTISVYAGEAGEACHDQTQACGDGGSATGAQLAAPLGLAVDTDDNLYIADGHRVRKVAAVDGTISTFAGDGHACAHPTDVCGDGGAASGAQISQAGGLAIDGDGNVYVSDVQSHRVRKVAAAGGTITTFAGDGTIGTYGGDGTDPADLHAQFASPSGLWFDSKHGAFEVADGGANRVRALTNPVRTLAGTGEALSSGDLGPATDATLDTPQGGVADAVGNVYITERSRIRIVTQSRAGKTPTIGTFAGDGTGCAGSDNCGDGGLATAAHLDRPWSIAIDDRGNLYISDVLEHRIRKISPSGFITTFAGDGTACPHETDACGDGGTATSAQLNTPKGLSWDSADHALLVADTGDERIRKITTSGDARDPDTITTIAGGGNVWGEVGNGGPATSAGLGAPSAVLYVDPSHIYVNDSCTVRVFADGGDIEHFTGHNCADSGDGGPAADGLMGHIRALAYDPGTDTIAMADSDYPRLRFVTAGVITATQGGPPTFGGDSGDAAAANLAFPLGLAWSAQSGNLYIADLGDHRVRVVDPQGHIGTTAGDGAIGDLGDGGPAYLARLRWPVAVAVDASNRLYIADAATSLGSGYGRVRKIAENGDISTIAGTSDFSNADAPSATDAAFGDPRGIVRAANGDLYVSDATLNRVRKIDHATGAVSAYAGSGAAPTWGGDGGLAKDAGFYNPSTVARDPEGNTYVASYARNRVRVIRPDGSVGTFAGVSDIGGYSGDGGPATEAKIGGVQSLAVDADGDVFIGSDHYVREVTPDGIIHTVAGGGNGNCTGYGGPATSFGLVDVAGIAIDSDAHHLYVASPNCGTVSMVDLQSGDISLFAGNGTSDYSGDNGPPIDAGLAFPGALAWDHVHGALYIAGQFAHMVRKVEGGIITTALGNGSDGNSGDGGPGTSAETGWISAMTYNPVNGSLYVVDPTHNRIRELDANGSVWAFAGDPDGSAGFAGDGGPIDTGATRFDHPQGIALTTWGTTDGGLAMMLVADTYNNRVREIALDAAFGNNTGWRPNFITTIAGHWAYDGYGPLDGFRRADVALSAPDGMAIASDGTIYVSDRGSRQVLALPPDDNGTVRVVAGDRLPCDAHDPCGDGGPANKAELTDPAGLAIDERGDGSLYIADQAGNRVRVVDLTTGSIGTVTGNGDGVSTGDDGPAIDATVFLPGGLAVHDGDLYITEVLGSRIRKVHAGTITTVAGDGNSGQNGDGGPATAAEIEGPLSIAFDGTGQLYFTEHGDKACSDARIRKVDLSGDIHTVAGPASGSGSDNGGALGARLCDLGSIVFDDHDDLYLANGGFGSANLGLTEGPTFERVRRIVGPL